MDTEIQQIEKLSRDSWIMKIIIIAALLIVGKIIIKISYKALNKRFTKKSQDEKYKSKIDTITGSIFSFIKFIVYFILIMIILDMLGVNTSSILATAGIGGIAIAFGAQSIVSDIIRGIFILLDGQLNVGDWVSASGIEGTVESVGLRITKIRDYDGSLYTIPNSQIETVKNSCRGEQKSDITFQVSYDISLEKVKEIIEKIGEESSKEIEFIQKPIFLGVDDLGEFSYKVKVTSSVKAMDQWKAMRILRKNALKEFEKSGMKTSILDGENEKIQIE
ncbi:MAG: mechanosensitive ion channel family protein [Tissierellia bacterium]|nr:mechanosensitive ion channel family protein [Tissierellia bacterium]